MAKKKRKKKQPESPFSTWIAKWGAYILPLVAFILYTNTLTHDFVLDDAIVITENEFTQQGLSGLKSIFSYDTFRGFFQEEGKENLVAGGRYRPLTQAMFAIEFSLFGDTPFPGHLINVLLYSLVCLLLYRLLLLLLQGRRRDVSFLAFATALLFTCHPVHTEVVANIKSRDEIVVMLCGIGSFFFMLQHFKKPQTRTALLGASLLFLALLSKESAVTFLLLIPMAGILFYRLPLTSVLRRTMPLVASFCIYLAIRSLVLGWGIGSDPPQELMNNPFLILVNGNYQPMTLLQKAPLVLLGLGKYIQLSLCPIHLSYDYYPRYFDITTFTNWKVVLSLAIHLALVVFAFLSWKKRPIFTYAILWYLLPILLVANIFFPVGTHISERFLFIPSVGVSLLLATFLFLWYQKKGELRYPLVVLLLISLLGSAQTINRNPVWKDNFSLFTQDVDHAGQSAKARNSAAGALIERALTLDNTSKEAMLEEARQHLEEALQIHPQYKNAHLLLGNANLYLRDFDLALSQYEKALELDPGYAEALNNQAVAHREFGKYWGEEKQDIQQAINHLLQAYTYLTQDFETIRLLGVAYGNMGNHTQAVKYFEQAHEISPSDVVVVRSLQTVHTALGQIDRAEYYRALAEKIENQ